MDYKNLDIDKLIEMINAELKKGNSLVKIAKEVFSASESSIRKYLKRRGYKRVNNQFILEDTVEKKDVKDSFPSTTKEHIELIYEENKTEIIPSNTSPHTDNMTSTEIIVPNKDNNKIIFPKGGEEIIIDLIKNYDKIMEVVNSYSNHTQYEDNNGIVIELPFDNEQLRVTTRVNSWVWNEFGKFCLRNSSYKKMDLVSMALKEYMQKYDK